MAEKLVRDLIPQIIRDSGTEPVFREYGSEEEYKRSLLAKLEEEVAELKAADTDEKRAEEIADVLEVVDAIAYVFGIKTEDIERIKTKKFRERGGFFCGYILKMD